MSATASALTPRTGPLRAATHQIDPPDDVLDFLGDDGVAWLHEGASFATSGIAARVPADEAVEFLAAIAHDADPTLSRLGLADTGPIAVGVLAFDPSTSRDSGRATTELVVPARVTGRTADGRGWVTEIDLGQRLASSAQGSLHRRDSAPPPLPQPSEFYVRGCSSRTHWQAAVTEALRAIHDGELTKVVLARAVAIDANEPFDRRAVLRRLRDQQPGCFVYAAGTMIGASPELLVARSGSTVVSRPLAGTAVLGDDAVEALRHSTKDMREHQLVVDAIREALIPWCTHLDAPSVPEIDRFADVAHLATPIYGTLRDPVPDVLTLVRALHPTPAVGGIPTAAALGTIAALEPESRGSYAGPVGWVDARGDGEWAVALRGAHIVGNHALLHAGAGIVAGSDPDAEWAETEAKLVPMLTALVRP